MDTHGNTTRHSALIRTGLCFIHNLPKIAVGLPNLMAITRYSVANLNTVSGNYHDTYMYQNESINSYSLYDSGILSGLWSDGKMEEWGGKVVLVQSIQFFFDLMQI